VDVSKAGCFDPKAEHVIRKNIVSKFGSEDALTDKLQLILGKQLAKIVQQDDAEPATQGKQQGALDGCLWLLRLVA
jgi:hypothetical protein